MSLGSARRWSNSRRSARISIGAASPAIPSTPAGTSRKSSATTAKWVTSPESLLFSERLLRPTGIRADRKIIDVSGDGPNNSGPLLRPTRASVLAGGVTINGLAIALRTKEERTFGPFAFTTIRSYYRDCVIGGAGAFVIAVDEVDDFEPAIRTKLTTEIAEMHPLTQGIAYVSEHPLAVDCEASGS